VPELIANRYRIDRPLDVGAVAFQAYDLQLSRSVVVKCLPAHRTREPRFARQFYQEATAAARLTHPNLVGVYDVCENGAHAPDGKPNGPDPFMVLEWVAGSDLRAYLATRESLPSDEVDDSFERRLNFLIEVCRGLHHGHEQGVIHRSVNPENIRVTPTGHAKILNFGITPFRKPASRRYLSPEQLEGQAKPDRRSDLFSLGVVLYELLFGVHPFEAETEDATASRILGGKYRGAEDLLPGCAGELSEIVNRLLARDPAERFEDGKLLESELRRLRSRLGEEKEACRTRLVSLRAALKKDTRSQNPGQARLFDLAVLESADPSSEDYEHLLRSCNELGGVIERVKRQAQIEKMIDSAEADANAGQFEAAFALLADVIRADPGNARAQSLETKLRRRKEVSSLLQEARQSEAEHDVAMACILALQAVQLDPDASDARAEFERLQAVLRIRKEQAQLPVAVSESRAEENVGLIPRAPAPARAPARFLGSRFLSRVVPILGVLLLLGFVWIALTREGPGPAPVSARNVPVRNVPAATKAQAPRFSTVSLDVVPWAKVDSITDLKDGKPVEHEELEAPCTFRLPVGRYSMTVSHPEFGSRLLRMEVKDGITNVVKLSLLSGPQLEKEVGVGRR